MFTLIFRKTVQDFPEICCMLFPSISSSSRIVTGTKLLVAIRCLFLKMKQLSFETFVSKMLS